MTFEVFDRESGNLVAAFESEAETAEFVARAIAQDPRDGDELSVVAVDPEGSSSKSWTAAGFISARAAG